MGLLTDEQKMRIIGSLSLMDDILFSKCFSESTECTTLMLNIILGRDDLIVTEARTQEWMQGILTRSVRLDVYAQDRSGNIYDIEIQRSNKGARRRRARYYSAMMDTSALGKGLSYDELPESYVIFITERDALGDGNALYEIERTIKGSGIPFDDGSHIIYVSADLADYDTELGKLMHDLRCTDPEEMEYDVLKERVRYFKGKTEGRIEMASEFDKVLGEILKEIEDKRAKENLERGLKEGTEKGLKAGRMEEARRVARSMIADGSIPLPKVAEFSGLTLSEVESISSSFKA